MHPGRNRQRFPVGAALALLRGRLVAPRLAFAIAAVRRELPLPLGGQAQPTPDTTYKPVPVAVAVGAGGAADLLTRAFAKSEVAKYCAVRQKAGIKVNGYEDVRSML